MASAVIGMHQVALPGMAADSSMDLSTTASRALSPVVPPVSGFSMQLDPVASFPKQQACGPSESSREQHPLISWFEQEVRPELTEIRTSLDQLVMRVGDRVNGGPRRFSRASVRRPSECSVRRPSLALTVQSVDENEPGWRRPSLLSSSIRSDNTCTSALGVVFCTSPDGSKGQKLALRRDMFPVAPTEYASSSAGALPHATRGSVQGSLYSVRSEKEIEKGSNFSSVRSEKEIEKAEVLSRFQRRGWGTVSKVWHTLEEPESSRLGRWCAKIMPLYIVFTVCVTLLQMISPPPLHGLPAAVMETTIDSIFLLEFLVRLVACPNHVTFWLDVYNLIDLAAAAPLALRLSAGPVLPRAGELDAQLAVLLCGVPVVRTLKLLRRFEKLHLLLQAFNLAAEALPVLLFMLFAIELVFSVLIYLVEPRDNIPSLPTAIWMTMVTMTTVGYGDVTPTSVAGSIITGVLVVVTVLYMAIPLGIIGNAFTLTWNERDRLLLMQRTRDRLRQWGYSAHDIPLLFRLSAEDNDQGQLDVTEFRELLKGMQIGFSDERIFQLFKSFDHDHSGMVDDKDFVRSLFPNSYHEIYSGDKSI